MFYVKASAHLLANLRRLSFPTIFLGLYFNRDAFDLHYGLGILRVPGGFDRHKVPDDFLDLDSPTAYDSDEFVDDIGWCKIILIRYCNSFSDK